MMICETEYRYEEIKFCQICKGAIEIKMVRCGKICFHKECLIKYLRYRFGDT